MIYATTSTRAAAGSNRLAKDFCAGSRRRGGTSRRRLRRVPWRRVFFTYPGSNLDAYAPFFDPVTHENASVSALYAPLEAMFRAINESPDGSFVETVSAYLDLPLFMRHVAVQNFLAQWDGILGYAGANNLP